MTYGENNKLKLSFQISIPGGESGGGSSSQSDSTIVNSIESSTIDSGINLMNSYLSKEINLAHCKVIVFSEQFAYNGLYESLYTLINKTEIRPTANVIISRCSTEYFLKNSQPILEKLSARYYDIVPTSSQYTGYTEDLTLSQMFSDLNDTFKQCYAILGGVNTANSHNKDNKETSYENDANNKAQETLITSQPNIENMGLAVFSGDSLVGELNGIETICHQLISNSLSTCIITIPSPFEKDDIISVRIKQASKTRNKVKLVNDSPYITSHVYLDVRILTMNQNSEYLNHENVTKLETYINSYLEEHLNDYFYKISKEYNSDIDGFGRYVVKDFSTWADWSKYNWLDNFKNSFFKPTVHSTVKSGYIFLET